MKARKQAVTMSLAEARAIVGNANSCEPYLSNMIRALSYFPWLNTPEQEARLVAARIVRRHNHRRGM